MQGATYQNKSCLSLTKSKTKPNHWDMIRLTLTTASCLLLACFSTGQSAWSIASFSKDAAFLGIQSDQISREKAKLLGFDNYYGSYVTKVVEGTAAHKAGLQAFDYIIGIDKYETSEEEDLSDILERFRSGDKVNLHFVRKRKRQRVELTMGGYSDKKSAEKHSSEKPFLGISPYGDDTDDEMGVKIYVVEGSTAEEIGLKDGDIILSINDYPMVDWSDITTAIELLKPGENIAVEFEHKGKKIKAAQAIKSYSDTKKQEAVVSSWNPDGYAFLGVHSNRISDEKAKILGFENKYGSYVSRVIGNTAAEKAGLQPFDYIYGINEYRTNEAENLTTLLKKFKPGDKATIYFIRNGEKKEIEVLFSKRSESKNYISDNDCEAPFLGVQEWEVDESAEKGVAVQVVDKSTAKIIGLQDGDKIVAINGHTIVDWEDITIAIDNMKVGETIKVEYLRANELKAASGAIKSRCETRSSNYWRYEKDEESEAAITAEENFQEVPLDKAFVEMKDMSAEDINDFKNRFGIDLPSTNNLSIQNLQLFPNASIGSYQLQFNLPQAGETSLRVYNAAGRMIYNYDLGMFSGDFNDKVDISQNGAGSYFLEIQQGDKAMTKKIILQSK